MSDDGHPVEVDGRWVADSTEPVWRGTAEGFEVDVRWLGAGDGAGDGAVRARITRSAAAEPRAVGIRLGTSLADAVEPWWLIPGLFYGENRPIRNDRVFPRFERGASGAENARRFVSSAWEFRSDRAATPVVFAWAGPGRGGTAIAADASTALGLTGLGFDHDEAAGRLRVHATFPFREAPVTYFGDEIARSPEFETHLWGAGETHELFLRIVPLDADRHSYAPILRELHAESAPRAPLRPWVGVDHAAQLAAEGLLRWHYDPDPGVLIETVGFDREVSGRDGLTVDRQAMHVGWVSGIPWAFALLAHGVRVDDSTARSAARSVVDFIAGALSPSGTFWGVWYREHGWSQSWTSIEHGLHSRTLAEATLFLVRALTIEPEHPTWRAAVASNLDAIVARQRADGNLGSVHHALTGEVLSWEGASGLTWIPALLEAADAAQAMDVAQRYRRAAERAGEYYESFVRAEFIHGAPEDVDLAPTSEDGYAAVMAYVALHRASGDDRWLDLARRSADWMLTFRYSYDVVFPEHTLLGRYDFGTRGADQASPSNQHLHAYGLVCTQELFQLSDALGDDHYRERALETLACFRQFVAREDGDFNAYRGMVTERYYQTSCFQPKGMLLTLSHAWSAGVLLLGCEQTLAAAL